MSLTKNMQEMSFMQTQQETYGLIHNKLKHQRVKTQTLTSLPQNKKAMGCKQAYKIKHNPNGAIECYKVHLVAKGYNQQEEIDYQETSALVAKLTTMHCSLAIVAIQNWHLH